MTDANKPTQSESNPWRAAYYEMLQGLGQTLEHHVMSVREIHGNNNPERAVRKETLQIVYDLASNKGRDLSATIGAPREVTPDLRIKWFDGRATVGNTRLVLTVNEDGFHTLSAICLTHNAVVTIFTTNKAEAEQYAAAVAREMTTSEASMAERRAYAAACAAEDPSGTKEGDV